LVSLQTLFGDDARILRDREYQILLLVTVPVLLGTTLLSPVLDSLIGPLGATPATVGLLISAFTAPAIAIIPLAGALADRVGRKPILVVSILLFGCAGSAIALTSDFRVALFLRFLQGVSFAGASPIIITSIRDIYDGSAEATGQGLRVMVSGLSQTVFSLLAGLLVVVAWQAPFVMYTMAIPVALVVYIWFEEPVSPERLADDGSDGYGRALLGLLGQRRVFVMVLGRGLFMVAWFGFLTYNSILVVRVLDGSPGQAGALVAISSLLFAITASQAGRITARFESRFYPLLGAKLGLGVGLGAFALAPDFLVAAAGVVLAGLGFGLTLSMFRSIVSGLAPPHLRGGLVSLGEASSRVAATVTPIAIGAVVAATTPTLGFETAVRVAVGGAVLVGSGGPILCVLIARATPRVESEAPTTS
jgi:MFS family permease